MLLAHGNYRVSSTNIKKMKTVILTQGRHHVKLHVHRKASLSGGTNTLPASASTPALRLDFRRSTTFYDRRAEAERKTPDQTLREQQRPAGLAEETQPCQALATVGLLNQGEQYPPFLEQHTSSWQV